MKKNGKFFPAALALAVLFWIGCTAQTGMRVVESSSDYSPKPVSSFLVVGVGNQTESEVLYENTFANLLKQNGAQATALASVLSAGQRGNREAVVAAAQKLGVQAVLVTTLLGEEAKESYNPSTPRPFHTAHSTHMGVYYHEAYTTTHQPGYYNQYTLVRLENSLYDLKTQRLVWRGESSTYDPLTAAETIKSLGPVLIKSLKKDGFVAQ